MIDEHNLIDSGTDILAESSLYNSPLSAVNHVFITHTHEDHFSLERNCYPIRFYCHQHGVKTLAFRRNL